MYDGWGKKRAGPADVVGFGGQAGYSTDTETGLVLCTNRYYDPQQGRFLTRDPLGYAGGVNLYGYTANDPVNFGDPSGFGPEQIEQAAQNLPPGARNVVDAGLLAFGLGVIAYERLRNIHLPPVHFPTISWPFNNPTQTNLGPSPYTPPSYASGSENREVYLHEQEKLKAALEAERELQNRLDKATGPKIRRPIEKELDKLRKGNNGIEGHLKKILQGWPDGCPSE